MTRFLFKLLGIESLSRKMQTHSSRLMDCHSHVSGKFFRIFGTWADAAAGGDDGCLWIFPD